MRIDGLVLIDKPLGMTSNAALQKIKKVLHVKKAGHTGSLDPLASGMLPICLGQATKFSEYLLSADKSYQVTAKLGVRTSSGDLEGEVVSNKPVPELTSEMIENCLNQFRGAISQVPSMYSALKHNGLPLYLYARQGIEIPREARAITIYELRVLSVTANQIELFVHCSKGTYIRSLVEDIGEFLGCGAHVTHLRRLSVGAFKLEQMLELAQVAAEKLPYQVLPIQAMLSHLPVVTVSPALVFYLRQGQSVEAFDARHPGLVCLQQTDGVIIGVGEVSEDGRIMPRKILSQLNAEIGSHIDGI